MRFKIERFCVFVLNISDEQKSLVSFSVKILEIKILEIKILACNLYTKYIVNCQGEVQPGGLVLGSSLVSPTKVKSCKSVFFSKSFLVV